MPLNIFCSLPSLERKEEEERKGKREGRKGGREEETFTLEDGGQKASWRRWHL